MEKVFFKNLLFVKYGILLSLLTILYGFFLGGAFGAKEDSIKGYLNNNAKEVFSTVYSGDKTKMDKVVKKSWGYFKRAHLHANAIGTTSLALILLLSFLPVKELFKRLNSIILGVGSLGYSSFWMFAGMKAPGLGSTHLAKESLKWLAVPSAGLCIIGVVAVVGFTVKTLFLDEK